MLNLKKNVPNIDSTQTVPYPFGNYRNDDPPGSQTGTPWYDAPMTDIYYALYSILSDAGITPNENPENVQTSDVLNAVNKKFRTKTWCTPSNYQIGDTVNKQATSALLGTNASRVSLVYRSRTSNNKGHALPADFISDANWDWVDVIQPQGLNLLDLSGHIGSTLYTKAIENNIPKNWAISDGRTVTLPDGTTYTTVNAKDRFILASNTDVGTTGGSSTHTTSLYGSGRRSLSAYGTLSYGNLPSWSIAPHGQYGNGYVNHSTTNDSNEWAIPRGHTDGSNGNSQHRGGTSAQFSVTGRLDGSEYHSHTLNGLPPYLKLNIIERIF